MRTLDESLRACLSSADVAASEHELRLRNLHDLARDVANSEDAVAYCLATVTAHMTEWATSPSQGGNIVESMKANLLSLALSAMVAGIRIGLDMEKQDGL